MLKRRLRTTLELLKPTASNKRQRDSKIESQFNKPHGARLKIMHLGDSVYVKDFGSVLYQVETSEGLRTRHANQIRPVLPAAAATKRNINVFLYDFGIANDNIQPVANLGLPSPDRAADNQELDQELNQEPPNDQPPLQEDHI